MARRRHVITFRVGHDAGRDEAIRRLGPEFYREQVERGEPLSIRYVVVGPNVVVSCDFANP